MGLHLEDKVWHHSTLSANRPSLFNEDLARLFVERGHAHRRSAKLIGDEHVSVDSTLIDAWASQRSFKRKMDDSSLPPGCNPELDFKG